MNEKQPATQPATQPVDPFTCPNWNGLSSQAVANFFLQLANRDAKPISNLKMQKLVYFAHAVSLANHGKPLIKDTIEAWQYGPLIPSLYECLKIYGSKAITGCLACVDKVEDSQICRDIVNATWGALGNQTAGQLVDLSHAVNGPWHQIWNNGIGQFNVIPNNVIQSSIRQP